MKKKTLHEELLELKQNNLDLRDAIVEQEQHIQSLETRLTQLEVENQSNAIATPRTEASSETPDTSIPARQFGKVENYLKSRRPDDQTASPDESFETTEVATDEPGTFEMAIGQTWLNRIGAVVLFCSVAFFVKYSFDQGWISPVFRVLAGAAAGVVLLAIGEFCLHRKMRHFAAGILGCGIGILYLSAFGAYHFYHLIDQSTAFILCCSITAISVGVSLQGNLLPVAMLAAIGGFAPPVALSTGTNAQVSLLTYVLILDIGFLVCTQLRRWDALRIIAWVGTTILFLGWAGEYYNQSPRWITWGFIATFYILFHAETVLGLLRKKFKHLPTAVFIVTLNNILFFTTSYLVLRTLIPDYLGLFAVLSAGLQWLTAWRLTRDEDDIDHARLSMWTSGAAMLALAPPLQFDAYLVTVSWMVQGLITAWFFRRYETNWLKLKLSAVLIAGICHLVFFDYTDNRLSPILIQIGHWKLNWLIIMFVFVGLSQFAAAAILTLGKKLNIDHSRLANLFLVLGSFLILAIFADQWERYLATWWWIILGIAMLLASYKIPQAREIAAAVVLACIIKFFVYDTLQAANSYWRHLSGIVINRAVFTGLVVATLAAITDLIISKKRKPEDEHTWIFSASLAILLSAITLTWTGSFEIIRVFKFEPIREQFDNARLAMHVALSVFWSISATACLFIGFARKLAALRYKGLTLFLLTVVKVLVFDLGNLDMIYRIISFLVLGVLLILGSLLYQRRSMHNKPPLSP